MTHQNNDQKSVRESYGAAAKRVWGHNKLAYIANVSATFALSSALGLAYFAAALEDSPPNYNANVESLQVLQYTTRINEISAMRNQQKLAEALIAAGGHAEVPMLDQEKINQIAKEIIIDDKLSEVTSANLLQELPHEKLPTYVHVTESALNECRLQHKTRTGQDANIAQVQEIFDCTKSTARQALIEGYAGGFGLALTGIFAVPAFCRRKIAVAETPSADIPPVTEQISAQPKLVTAKRLKA